MQNLLEDLVKEILKYLSNRDILSFSSTNRRMRKIGRSSLKCMEEPFEIIEDIIPYSLKTRRYCLCGHFSLHKNYNHNARILKYENVEEMIEFVLELYLQENSKEFFRQYLHPSNLLKFSTYPFSKNQEDYFYEKIAKVVIFRHEKCIEVDERYTNWLNFLIGINCSLLFPYNIRSKMYDLLILQHKVKPLLDLLSHSIADEYSAKIFFTKIIRGIPIYSHTTTLKACNDWFKNKVRWLWNYPEYEKCFEVVTKLILEELYNNKRFKVLKTILRNNEKDYDVITFRENHKVFS